MSQDMIVIPTALRSVPLPRASDLNKRVLVMLDPNTGSAKYLRAAQKDAAQDEAMLKLMNRTPTLLISGGEYDGVTYITDIAVPGTAVNSVYAALIAETGMKQALGSFLYLSANALSELPGAADQSQPERPVEGGPQVSSQYSPATGPLREYVISLVVRVNPDAEVDPQRLLKGVVEALTDAHEQCPLWSEGPSGMLPDSADLCDVHARLIG